MLSYGGWTILQQSTTDIRTRSYFGIYQVNTFTDDAGRPYETRLTHGTTLHGVQNMVPGTETVPTSYYARRSAVGEALANAPQLYGPAARVGVVGLGTGTLSCYKQPGQSWSIYEIDPAMVEIARTRFSFLSKCAPDARIVLGDARLRLAEEAPNSMDILAVDAFSSDAVPMHLLTREALAVYGKAVQQDGIVLFHISNRYLDLKPVIADLAGERRMAFRPARLSADAGRAGDECDQLGVDRAFPQPGDDPEADGALRANAEWFKLEKRDDFPGWSDDYASIIPILKLPALPWQ
jgi:SAM-dependent methyltransferase